MLEAFRREISETEKSRTDLLKWKLLLVAGIGSFGLGFSRDESTQISEPLLLCLIPFVCVYVDSLCRHLQLRILVISDFYSRYRTKAFSEEICFSKYEEFCHEIRSTSSNEVKEKINEAIAKIEKDRRETRCKKLRSEADSTKDVFELEDWAMQKSTQVICSLLIIVSLLFLIGSLSLLLETLLLKYENHFATNLVAAAENYACITTVEQQDVITLTLILISGLVGIFGSQSVDEQFEKKRETLRIVARNFKFYDTSQFDLQITNEK